MVTPTENTPDLLIPIETVKERGSPSSDQELILGVATVAEGVLVRGLTTERPKIEIALTKIEIDSEIKKELMDIALKILSTNLVSSIQEMGGETTRIQSNHYCGVIMTLVPLTQ